MENWESNIENEYQKRFEDFEEMPPDFLWEKIQPQIQEEKKKRRGVIIWWQMGIAAALLIACTLGYNYFYPIQKIEVSERVEKTNNQNKSSEIQEAETEKIRILNEEKISSKIEVNIVNQLENKSSHSSKERVGGDPRWVRWNNEQQSIEETPKNEIVLNNENTEVIRNEIESNERKNLETSLTAITSINEAKFSNSFNINNLVINQPEKEPIIETATDKVLAFIPPAEVFANISPMLNYYLISPNRNDNFLVKSFNGSEQRLGFAAQFGLVYHLNKKLSSRNAISYFTGKSNISYNVLPNEPTNVTILNDHSLQLNNINLNQNEAKKWQYVELQSDLLYNVSKLNAVSVGMKIGFQTEKTSKPAFYARMGYRMNKPISTKIALWAEPSVVFSLTSQSSVENLFAYRTTGFSLNIGASLLR